MRKVYLKVVMSLQMIVDEGVEISDVMGDMCFVADDPIATIEDFTMVNYEIIDSK